MGFFKEKDNKKSQINGKKGRRVEERQKVWNRPEW